MGKQKKNRLQQALKKPERATPCFETGVQRLRAAVPEFKKAAQTLRPDPATSLPDT